MSYFGELRPNFRALVSASLGVGTSLPFDAYTNSIFAPYLIKAFHWSRAQFALYGLVAVATVVVLPVVGRAADRFGVKRVALIGTLLFPLCFVGYSQMQGSFGFFMFLSALKLAFGHMTSAIVYTRLIAENFARARGLALTIVSCTPAALGAIAAPALTWNIEHFGWRNSYLAVGAFSLICGLIAVILVPRQTAAGSPTTTVPQHAETTFDVRRDFGIVARSGAFWIIIVGMYLCMLATPLQSSQMNIMLQSKGLAASAAAWVISIYAISNIGGRIVCGLALDRFSTPLVTAISLMPPAFGFFVLATNIDAASVIAFCMVLFGLAVGAENDLLSFLIARYFKLRIFSFTLGLLMCCVLVASATGALLISASLKWTESFSPFLYLVSGTVLVGSLLFLFLPKRLDFEKVG